MMVFTGITLVLFYLINIFTDGFNKVMIGLSNNAEEIANKNSHTEEDIEEAKGLLFRGIVFITLIFTILFMYIGFLITAVSIDVFVIPTLIMITEFVGTTLLNFIFKKKNNEKKKLELTAKGYFISSLRASYVIYILVLIFI